MSEAPRSVACWTAGREEKGEPAKRNLSLCEEPVLGRRVSSRRGDLSRTWEVLQNPEGLQDVGLSEWKGAVSFLSSVCVCTCVWWWWGPVRGIKGAEEDYQDRKEDPRVISA